MKTKSSALFPWLYSFVLVLVLVALAFPSLAHAAETDGAVAVTTPWYADGAVIGSFIAAITSFFAIWSQAGKTKAQKVNESLVVAIEAATKIPAVAAQEKRIKGIIKATAEEYGVQPVLDRLVKDLT